MIKVGKLVFGLAWLLFPGFTFAQHKKNTDKNSMVMVVGKPLTRRDSVLVDELFYQALREKTMENASAAATLFSQVLEIDPANDAGMYELSRIRTNQNKDAEARQLLEKAVTVNPDNEWYWLALAGNYEKINDIPKLENVFKELVRLNPDKPDYYTNQARAFVLDKKYDEALAVYNQQEKLFGKNEESIFGKQKIYLKQGKLDLATKDLEELIRENPQEIRPYLQLSELYNSNNQNDKALKVLESAGKIDSDNALVHLALADVYRDKKDYAACFNQLKTAFAFPSLKIEEKLRIISGYFPRFPDPEAKSSALELSRIISVAHPDDARAFTLYGDMLVQNASYQQAIPVYRKSLTLNDQTYAVWEQIIRLELGENQFDQAIKDGEEALSLFPNQAVANYLLGVAYAQKGRVKEALSYFKNAISLNPTNKELLSQVYAAMGDNYHQQKDDAQSDASYDQSLTNNPDNAYTLNNYAYYLSLRGEKLDKAAQMSRRSNELQPDNASFEDTFAWVLFKQKKYPEAKTWMEKAIRHNQKSAGLAEHYGDVLYFLNDTENAVKYWKTAKQLGSSSAVLERKINEKKYIE
ncbi:tetratricopeptide repeat protein [Mucilaginibacter arboris]|uniref:Tetratricopeptide repeat protein n=1 Tax=Mucilaginibacter arboris TaxID=2682090 RepID=A0A7K1SRP5_9SPHI|nr:tetratricopeptide repeat protein [Mucilaginibacter arboris]MVN19971.1 tetratricopeptide repeat protein [Mucilaginibacter arboris]